MMRTVVAIALELYQPSSLLDGSGSLTFFFALHDTLLF